MLHYKYHNINFKVSGAVDMELGEEGAEVVYF